MIEEGLPTNSLPLNKNPLGLDVAHMDLDCKGNMLRNPSALSKIGDHCGPTWFHSQDFGCFWTLSRIVQLSLLTCWPQHPSMVDLRCHSSNRISLVLRASPHPVAKKSKSFQHSPVGILGIAAIYLLLLLAG